MDHFEVALGIVQAVAASNPVWKSETPEERVSEILSLYNNLAGKLYSQTREGRAQQAKINNL